MSQLCSVSFMAGPSVKQWVCVGGCVSVFPPVLVLGTVYATFGNSQTPLTEFLIQVLQLATEHNSSQWTSDLW